MSNEEKLKKLVAEIDKLLENKTNPLSEEFIEWKTKAERTLKRIYGENSDEYNTFKNRLFASCTYTDNLSNIAKNLKACQDALLTTRANFKVYLEELEETVTCDVSSEEGEKIHYYKKVFIVHGHDETLKQKVARLLERQNIKAIILNETPNLGRTIIEKIEAYARDVDAAICLFTADDEMADGSKRARQNVVFETGYFCGKIGRKNTIIVAESDVINLSDLDGVVYLSKDKWEVNVLKELREIGYKIDMNKL